MPNFKIFQDVPDQAKVKIYGSNDVAFNTDSSGNLTITSTGLAITAPANGLMVTAPAEGLSITSTGLAITAPANGLTVTAPAEGLSVTPPSGGLAITPPSNGLSITSTGLAITAPANGLTVTAPAEGLSITPPANGILITSTGLAITSTGLAVAVGTTDVSATRVSITDTAGTPDETYNVLDLRTWSFGVVNNSLDANAQALVTLQISPDATNWQNEVGPVTIDQNSMETFVSSIFLKYARLYYSAVNSASAVTLNIFFQGQT